MNIDHNTLVLFAKSFGLFYMMAVFACVVVYACWPSNQSKFDRAARSILEVDGE
ncbi:cbb3-type cytochrome c oxidase subunit 3 [Hyphococcus lacteus]|uniref:Cbb3-type cytochrome c oxidase subunit 3 n=1 Tax=Hyphococcus lacteus TaxID=3143536 RepID=A0ABV3Z6W8_9PROT